MVEGQTPKINPERFIVPSVHEVVSGVSSDAIKEALQPEHTIPLLNKLAEKSAWTFLHSFRVGLIVTGLVDSGDSSCLLYTSPSPRDS